MNELSPKRHDKFRTYRARKKAAGLRELRMWVPDFRSPEAKKALAVSIAAINASKDEQQYLAELEDCTAELWRDIP